MGIENGSFYTPPGMHAELESQLSIIPPNLRENYRNLEITAASVFLSDYGDFLNDKQRRHFEDVTTLFVEPESIDEIQEAFDQKIHNVDEHSSPIDGIVYIGYSEDSKDYLDPADNARYNRGPTTLWAGKFTLYPLMIDEIDAVDPKWLRTESEHFEATHGMSFADKWATLEPFVHSNETAHVMVHEKVHTVQDDSLPLPILEASAHYYERKVAMENGWSYTKNNNMGLFADLYENCVKDLGNDVHLLVFGNLESAKRDALLNEMKRRFSNEVIAQLSQAGESGHIVWRTAHVDELDLKQK